MGLARGLEGEFNFHLQLSADTNAVGVRDSIPNVGSGRVAVESFRVSYAGFNRSRNRAVCGNARVIEVIEEEYHKFFAGP